MSDRYVREHRIVIVRNVQGGFLRRWKWSVEWRVGRSWKSEGSGFAWALGRAEEKARRKGLVGWGSLRREILIADQKFIPPPRNKDDALPAELLTQDEIRS